MLKSHDQTRGPFRAAQLRSGDPYELADGHPIECLPSGGRHAKSNSSGAFILESDPDVESVGVDAGFTPDEHNLRAPDIAVGHIPDTPGWIPGAPPLAVEYADTGQDERDLQAKIHTLLGAGTRYVWVVRLTGPQRVEVHTPDGLQMAYPGDALKAPGILRNPVRVEALYDPAAAHEAALRNLLQRRGYRDLDAVLEKGREEGQEEGRKEGRKEGREEGRKEGQEEGRKEGRKEGREEGRKEGQEEGRKEGREEGELAVVLRQLHHVVGPFPEANRQRIGQLGRDDLAALSEALLEFQTPNDLSAWLADRNPITD